MGPTLDLGLETLDFGFVNLTLVDLVVKLREY